MIREWLSRRNGQDIDRKAVTASRTWAIEMVRAIFTTPITGLLTLENFTWLAVAVGVLLRLVEYAGFRKLYMDELSLLHNLTRLGVFDFHTMLTEEQLAPPGFLIVERLAVRLPLNEVLAARFIPLLCGIGSLFLMRLVTRRFLSRPAVPIAVGLFALSDWLLYYSAEIKQYSTDVALSLIALLLAARLKTAPHRQGEPLPDQASTRAVHRKLLALAAFGTLGVWFSYPLAFVLGGVGTYVMASAAIRRDWKTARWALWMSMAWAASFAACFRVSHAILTRGQFIWIWWDFAFLPLPPRSSAELERVFWQLINVFNSPADVLTPLGVLPSAFVALGLFVIGAFALGMRWPGGLYLLVSPLVFALVASALRQYPFHGRLLLFLVPMVHLLVAQGAVSLAWIGSLLVRVLAAGLPAWEWKKTAVACTCALLFVSPAFLLYEPAAELAYRLAITKNRIRPFDSHGDLRNDLLDYREYMQRKEKARESRERSAGARRPERSAAGSPPREGAGLGRDLRGNPRARRGPALV